MANTPRTLIPTILFFANALKKTMNKYSATLQKYLGEGLFTVLVFIVDLCIIFATAVADNRVIGEPWSDFNSVTVLTSGQINQVQGAYEKFLASNGIAVGGD